MNNDKVVLKNGTEIILESSQGIGALHTCVESKDAALLLWKALTEDNLKQVTVKNSSDLVVGNYSDMVLDHIEARDNSDATVQLMISLRSKTTEEILTERIAMLEEGQQTQDAAIDDLAGAVSDIAEGGVQ